jgi:hypothetical protein
MTANLREDDNFVIFDVNAACLYGLSICRITILGCFSMDCRSSFIRFVLCFALALLFVLLQPGSFPTFFVPLRDLLDFIVDSLARHLCESLDSPFFRRPLAVWQRCHPLQ